MIIMKDLVYFKIMMRKTFCRCSCFFKSNIYLEKVDSHVHYINDEQFREDYHNVSDIEF